ncbi:MAG: hypothetical protein ABFD50_15420 [Smithella sp.]
MKKIEVWIQDLHILCIAGDVETIRIYFADPSEARFTMEHLLKSEEVTQY